MLLLLLLLLGRAGGERGGVPLKKSKDSYWSWGVVPCYRKSELQLATLAFVTMKTTTEPSKKITWCIIMLQKHPRTICGVSLSIASKRSNKHRSCTMEHSNNLSRVAVLLLCKPGVCWIVFWRFPERNAQRLAAVCGTFGTFCQILKIARFGFAFQIDGQLREANWRSNNPKSQFLGVVLLCTGWQTAFQCFAAVCGQSSFLPDLVCVAFQIDGIYWWICIFQHQRCWDALAFATV